jgi:4-carboxymuconolactone decarboxylase
MLTDAKVSDSAYSAILARWDEIGAVELTALVGYYCMVALTLNIHRIPLPDTIPADLLRGAEQPDGTTRIPQLLDA